MCGQKPEKIIYKSRNYELATLPLDPYLESLKEQNVFQGPNTALHRGYLGTWKIKKKLLLLVELKGISLIILMQISNIYFRVKMLYLRIGIPAHYVYL